MDIKKFGKELKSKILQKEDISLIAHWIYSLYLDHDVEDNYQFEYSYEELNDIVNRLIAGEDVKL